MDPVEVAKKIDDLTLRNRESSKDIEKENDVATKDAEPIIEEEQYLIDENFNENHLKGDINIAAATDEQLKVIEEVLNTKHPLNDTWTVYYRNPNVSKTDWEQCVLEVAVVSTVEDFFTLFTNLTPPSGLISPREYYFFRKDIQPEWEYKRNANGGRWQTGKINENQIDEIWMETAMMLIGEQFEEDVKPGELSDVCGAVCFKRSADFKIALWTSSHDNKQSVEIIGKRMMELSGIDSVMYEKHQTNKSNKNKSKPLYSYDKDKGFVVVSQD